MGAMGVMGVMGAAAPGLAATTAGRGAGAGAGAGATPGAGLGSTGGGAADVVVVVVAALFKEETGAMGVIGGLDGAGGSAPPLEGPGTPVPLAGYGRGGGATGGGAEDELDPSNPTGVLIEL
jgi:hypothetical protein